MEYWDRLCALSMISRDLATTYRTINHRSSHSIVCDPSTMSSSSRSIAPVRTSLATMTPSPKELHAARALLNSYGKQKRRSTNSCLTAFVHKNLDGIHDVISARGQARDNYLLKYLVHKRHSEVAMPFRLPQALV